MMRIDPSIKSGELAFLCAVALGCRSPRDIISDGPENHKRCWRWLEKWERKGWYEFGVSLDLGWLTDKGRHRAWEAAVELTRRLDASGGED